MSRFGARLGIAASLAVLALIVSTIALAYFAQSLYLLLEANAFRPSAAAAITGGCAVALAAILGLVGRVLLRAKPAAHPVPAGRSNGVATDIAADLGALAAQQIVNTTREHPYGTVGAALAAGLAVGAVPELRKVLTGLLKH
jgi:type VI protein secretion system component VasK